MIKNNNSIYEQANELLNNSNLMLLCKNNVGYCFISSLHRNMGLALPLEDKRLTILLAVQCTGLLVVSN